MSGILTSFGGGGYAPLTLDISSTVNPDVPALLSAAGWLGVAQPIALVNNAKVNTLVIPASLSGATISLRNSAGALIGGVRSGGTALRTQVPISVDNLGEITAGGGDGGNGGNAWVLKTSGPDAGVTMWGLGGGGGAGAGFVSGSLTVSAATGGAAGSVGTARASGFGGDTDAVATGGGGGFGGAAGESGLPGADSTISGGYSSGSAGAASAPQVAGYYIDGNALVTWIATGTRKGRVKP